MVLERDAIATEKGMLDGTSFVDTSNMDEFDMISTRTVRFQGDHASDALK
jgi:hypothetical protein